MSIFFHIYYMWIFLEKPLQPLILLVFRGYRLTSHCLFSSTIYTSYFFKKTLSKHWYLLAFWEIFYFPHLSILFHIYYMWIFKKNTLKHYINTSISESCLNQTFFNFCLFSSIYTTSYFFKKTPSNTLILLVFRGYRLTSHCLFSSIYTTCEKYKNILP